VVLAAVDVVMAAVDMVMAAADVVMTAVDAVVTAVDVADAEARAAALVGIEAAAAIWAADVVEAVVESGEAPRRESLEASTADLNPVSHGLYPQQKNCCCAPYVMRSLQQAPNRHCQSL
jgi:hypothetical protein